MYICLHCGHRFDTPKSGHEGGYPEEPTDECPNCGSLDIEEAEHCDKCGEDFEPDEVVGHFCAKCIGKAITIDKATKYGADRKVSVELNGFLAWVFASDEIEEVLMRHFMDTSDNWQKRMVNEYCRDDLSDFSDWLWEGDYDAE